jgi:hypothetical protein
MRARRSLLTWLQIVGPANPLLKTCASFNSRHRPDRAPTSCHPVKGCFETTDGNRFEPTHHVKIKPGRRAFTGLNRSGCGLRRLVALFRSRSLNQLGEPFKSAWRPALPHLTSAWCRRRQLPRQAGINMRQTTPSASSRSRRGRLIEINA